MSSPTRDRVRTSRMARCPPRASRGTSSSGTAPALRATSTRSGGTFVAPDHGDGMYFQIELTATDSAGQHTTTSVNIFPRTVQLTFATNPGGFAVVYGGTSLTTPKTVTSVVGSTHTIYAP